MLVLGMTVDVVGEVHYGVFPPVLVEEQYHVVFQSCFHEDVQQAHPRFAGQGFVGEDPSCEKPPQNISQ